MGDSFDDLDSYESYEHQNTRKLNSFTNHNSSSEPKKSINQYFSRFNENQSNFRKKQ